LYSIEARREGKIFILNIGGYCETEAGVEIAEEVEQAFSAERPTGVIFNFARSKVINSCCISQLIEIMETINSDYHADIAICGLDQTKVTLFKMVGMLEIAELKDNLEAAKNFLSE
jgi:anti-anti-sigma regulatory factor